MIDKIEKAARRDGADSYVSTTKIPSFDDKGRVIGLMGIRRDIAYRIELDNLRNEKARIERKVRALEELNNIKSEFVSVVSHELRTPLVIIKEAVNVVCEGLAGAVNEKQKEMLKVAERNVKRLNGIIGDLLDVSRMERGMLKLQYSLVDLNELIQKESGFFKKQCEKKGIRLEYILPGGRIDIFIDPEKVDRVLANLITNALKFTEKGGSIKVELKPFEDNVRIGIIDDGIGIPGKDLPGLFSKFMQVSKPSLRKGGIGLGLSIAKELVEGHGGNIWAESRPGIGSKFYFTLPRFYRPGAIDDETRLQINDLLNKEGPVYIINLLAVNYRKLKQKTRAKILQMFNDLNTILNRVFCRQIRADKMNAQMILIDTRKAECGVFVPGITEKEAKRMCVSLRSEIERYFAAHGIENMFVNIAAFSQPKKRLAHAPRRFCTNLRIKKIFIGTDLRISKRVCYNVDVKLLLPDKAGEISPAVDISEGGVCFISKNRLETDAEINIEFEFSRKKRPIHAKARVAWIEKPKGAEAAKNAGGRYRIGSEFTYIKTADRRILSRIVKRHLS